MNKTLLFLSLFLLPYVVFAQEIVKVTDNDTWNVLDTATYRYVYHYQFQLDSLNEDSKKETKMLLLLGKKQSFFGNHAYYFIDSLRYLNSLGLVDDAQVSKGFTTVKFRGPTYKLVQEKPTLFNIRYATVEGHWEIEDTANLEWKLGNQTDSIAGFPCHNAFTYFRGRHYEAWYTTEIPISKGPYKFGGLPGLIVQINDIQQTHIFKLESVTETKSLIIQENKKTVKMNLSQLQQAQKNLKLQIMERIKQWAPDDIDKVTRYKKRILSENNPIELIDD